MDSWVRTCRPVSARSDPFQGKICKNDSMYKETAKRFIVMFVTAAKLFSQAFSQCVFNHAFGALFSIVKGPKSAMVLNDVAIFRC